MGGSAPAPEVPVDAWRRLFVAIKLLHALERIELSEGRSAVSLNRLQSVVREEVADLSETDLIFCVQTLSMPREIHYGVLTEEGSLTCARTRDTTTLLSFDSSLGQVWLTDNGRLLMRVAKVEKSWLYNDVDADRLAKAVERGQFADIPMFCLEMVRDLAAQARQIAEVTERPSMVDLRNGLIEEGTLISETLHKAKSLVQVAIDSLYHPDTVKAFETWRAANGIQYGLGNLQSEIDTVLQSTDRLSRRFVKFLEASQSTQSVRTPDVQFLDLIDSLTQRSDRIAQQLEAIIPDLTPWTLDIPFFSADAFAGAVDFSDLLAKSEQPPVELAFNSPSADQPEAQQRIHELLLRYREQIAGHLAGGPLTLVNLLRQCQFELLPGESIGDFAGLYASPEYLNEEGISLRIEHTHALTDYQSADSKMVTSNPLIWIKESKA